MSDNTFSNPKSQYDQENWKELSPEQLLGVLLHQLRNPISTIRGWTNLLELEEAKDHHHTAVQQITQKVSQLEKIHEALGEYLRDRSQGEQN